MNITLKPIGIIHSPFHSLSEMPIQPAGSYGEEGILEILPDYVVGLRDLDGFSHLYAIYFFHKAQDWKPLVIPFLDDVERGIFATRAPKRPNPVGLSLLEILSVKENLVRVKNIDILDGTPLLDIKPFVPQFEPAEGIRIGWLESYVNQVNRKRSDQRFIEMD